MSIGEHSLRRTTANIKVIDLFCGIGGLTHGLIKEGLDVVVGIDNDNTCKYVYEHNNKTRFIHEDILRVTAEDINCVLVQPELDDC